MYDPWNPSPDDVRTWAYEPGAAEPCQDWDLALYWKGHEKALLETASDDSCPNRRRMLEVLYFIVGQDFRDSFRSRPRPILEGFIRRAMSTLIPISAGGRPAPERCWLEMNLSITN